ncbi:MAG: cytochrome c oxidase subunit II [Planctomycetota bacterium]
MPALPTLLADINETYWFPPKASTFAEETDAFFMVIMWISLVFFVGIVIAMGYFAMKFRRRPGYKGDSSALHNNTLEITWTVIPTIIVIYIFYRGAVGYLDMVNPPEGDTIDINVTAQKWNWQFQYPNGAIDDELHIPENRNIRLRMRSIDVLHAFYVPAFRAKTDVVPGRVTTMWFQPTKKGDYDLFCAEYCGDDHSKMIKRQGVHVLNDDDYEKYLAKAVKAPDHPIAKGYWLWDKRGCKACHSLKPGETLQGPSFAGSYGNMVQLYGGGEVEFDDQYIQESIYDPQAKARGGYENASAMPSFVGQLSLDDVQSITAFLKEMGKEDFYNLVADDDGLSEDDKKALGISDADVAAAGSGEAEVGDDGSSDEENAAEAPDGDEAA